MLQFAEDEILIPTGPHAGRPYRTSRQPYSALLFRELENWLRKVVTGPTQSGKTLQAFVIPTMFHLFEIGETVICGLPSLDMADDKWKRDLLPAIERSAYRELLPKQGAGSRGGTPDIITFQNGAQLKFMGGGGGDKQRAHFTSRVVIITETDGLDQAGESSREADKIAQLIGRTRAFGERSTVYMECTVSTTEGRTWTEYEAGTASRIATPCPHCGVWVSPERDHLRGWQDAPTEIDAAERAHFVCPNCNAAISSDERVAMNQEAKLVHRGQTIDAGGTVLGAPPRTRTLGFRWSAFHNLLAPVSQLGADEWVSQRKADRENAEKEMNQFVWCIPVKEDRIERSEITAAIVRGSHEDYGGRCTGLERGVIPDAAIAVTKFVDVHSRSDRLLYYTVCAWLAGRRCVVIDYGQFGDPGLRDVVGQEQSIWMNLCDLRRHWRENPYRKRTGVFPAGEILVDSGFMQHIIFRFVSESRAESPDEMWRASMGDPSYQHPRKKTKEKKPSPNQDPWYLSRQRQGIWQVNMLPDHWKGVVHDAFLVKPLDDSGAQRSGSIRLFGDDFREHYRFADQVTAEKLQREFGPKGWVLRWVPIGRENHYLDCMYGNFVGASICGALDGDGPAAPPSPPPPSLDDDSGFIRKPSGRFLRRRAA